MFLTWIDIDFERHVKEFDMKQNNSEVRRLCSKNDNHPGVVTVYITIDAEPSIGGAFLDPLKNPVGKEKRIFGKIKQKSFGIQKIIDIGNEFNLKFSFFVECLSSLYFGVDEIKGICDYIQGRGHDVQLHIHPEYLALRKRKEFISNKRKPIAFFSRLPLDVQTELVQYGKHLLKMSGVKNPIAFRAGSFGANTDTLIALQKCGFIADSSYNMAYDSISNGINKEKRHNDVWLTHNVFEFPVTNFRQFGSCGIWKTRPMDINGAGFLELKNALMQANAIGPKTVTVVGHSFSFIKSYDLQYERVRARKNVVRRFRRLCQYLAENSNLYKVSTFSELDASKASKMVADRVDHFPNISLRHSCVRIIEQLYDRFF